MVSKTFRVAPHKVVGLYTRPLSLAELRKARESYLGNTTGDYARIDHVRKELNYAKRIFSMRPTWKRISVTNKPIEEIASEIIRLFAKEEN